MFRRLFKTLLLSITLVCAAQAQAASPPVRVITFVLPPFVMEQQGSLTGFSIDLWTAIAAKMGIESRYEMARDVKDVFDELRTGKRMSPFPAFSTRRSVIANSTSHIRSRRWACASWCWIQGSPRSRDRCMTC
ncbi:transporter substrate-binding domain-containing protein [Paraburkholderia sp. EG304]|uniref:transporter substrate-binding domain-containing protein n=1 Tax=Paraburkholderia sp. EG304 TaxID=3237015 RepID=UPI00397D7A2E